MTTHVVGIFSFVDTTQAAVRAVKSRGQAKFTVYMPTYIAELAHEVDNRPSGVRWFTLLGAITGFGLAVLMTGWMSLDWPLRTSMKPVLAWPAFTPIMFECTVLVGGLVNLLALFAFAGLPKLRKDPGFDPRFTDDKFGVVVEASDAGAAEVELLLRTAGAEEVRRV